MGCCTTLEAEVPDNASVGIESPRELRLHDLLDDYESDAQTVSEPGAVTKSVRDKVLIIRAKLKHQIDSDPNQFARLNQVHQHDLTPRDRERISEWANGVASTSPTPADCPLALHNGMAEARTAMKLRLVRQRQATVLHHRVHVVAADEDKELQQDDFISLGGSGPSEPHPQHRSEIARAADDAASASRSRNGFPSLTTESAESGVLASIGRTASLSIRPSQHAVNRRDEVNSADDKDSAKTNAEVNTHAAAIVQAALPTASSYDSVARARCANRTSATNNVRASPLMCMQRASVTSSCRSYDPYSALPPATLRYVTFDEKPAANGPVSDFCPPHHRLT
jgi:hypothetical protein